MPITGNEQTIAAYLKKPDGTLYRLGGGGGSGGISMAPGAPDPEDGDVIVWDPAAGGWVPEAPAAATVPDDAITVDVVPPTGTPVRDELLWFVV